MYDIDTETAAGNIFNDWCKFNDCLVVISSSQQFEGEDADQKYCEISIHSTVRLNLKQKRELFQTAVTDF